MSTIVQADVKPTDFDPKRAEAFAERMLETFNAAAVTLMISVGHRVGLFDALARLDAATVEEIAAEAGLHERYVREWLAAMAVGGVVEVDEAERFRLPPEHASQLTRDAEANLATVAQYIPLLGSVEDDIVRCFREGGGVPYDRYTRFHEVMEEESAQTVVGSLHDRILPLIPGIQERLAAGIRVADLGCGRGRALRDLAARYPASTFVGLDLSKEAIDYARARAEAEGLRNVAFEVRDLSDFDVTAEQEAFDLVTTFDAVHDQARPAALLRGIARSLRPGGVYLMQDIHASSRLHGNFDNPLAAYLYTISCMHCMSVSLAQGGEGLGTMWGQERALAMLREAGFSDVTVHRLEHDIINDYFIARV
jgi:2-polyprenyl-3-methyl-5-hydroxy-6-metoxy-1,4-benzoquinol methylase